MVMWEVWRDVTLVSMLKVYFNSHWEGEFKKFLPVFPFASFYQKIQQTMKIQEIPRKPKVLLGAPWIFLRFLESAWFGSSGKSLLLLAS